MEKWNILKNLTFQSHAKALVWSKGLKNMAIHIHISQQLFHKYA